MVVEEGGGIEMREIDREREVRGGGGILVGPARCPHDVARADMEGRGDVEGRPSQNHSKWV